MKFVKYWLYYRLYSALRKQFQCSGQPGLSCHGSSAYSNDWDSRVHCGQCRPAAGCLWTSSRQLRISASF